MMERTAHQLLASSAHRLARKVFASLPFSQRLAQVYLKLSNALAQGFGATVYAAALYYGAEGLPPVKGEPASNFGPKEGESFKTFINRVTRNPAMRSYGYEFGAKFFNFCRTRFGEEAATDYLMTVVAEVLDPTSTLHHYFKTQDITHLEKILYQKAKNDYVNKMRSVKQRKTDGMPMDQEGGEIDLPDRNLDPDNLPNKMVLKKLDEALDEPDVRRKVEEAAKNLGPDLDTYFELLMDGFEPREIYNLRLLPSMQTNLPPELRITDPTRSDPFHTSAPSDKRAPGDLTNKQKELRFKDELAKYPNPMYVNPTTFMNQHKALMKALQNAIQD